MTDDVAPAAPPYSPPPTGLAVTTPDGRWVWVNDALASMLGYEAHELIGRSFVTMTHPDDIERSLATLDRAREGDAAALRFEKRLMHKRGHPVWVMLESAPIPGPDGVPLYFATQIYNDTARKVAEAALRESEARYRGLHHGVAVNAPGVVYQYVYRPDGAKGFTYASEGVRTLFGVSPEAMLQDPGALFNLIHPDDRDGFYASGLAAVAALAPWSWEGRAILPDGQERYVQIASRNVGQPDGSVIADGVLMDITEQHRTARRLEESEQRYRSLFEHHPDAVFSLDTEGRFTSANPACEATSGFRSDELMGESFEPLLVPEDLELGMRHFTRAVAGEAQAYEVAIRHRDGHRVELDVTNIPMVVGGRVVGVFGIAKDLTTRRALEAQLRQAQKMEAVGQLAGGVAHDFNNILTAITGFAELLHTGLDAADPRRADVEEILKGTQRASGLTRQLLAFSRKQVLQLETLDLNQLVTDTTAMLRPLFGGTLQIVTRLGSSPVPVKSDRTQLEQVLLNLALNARDAMPDGGTLTMVVDRTVPEERAPGGSATLVVSDTGVGMTPDVASRAFEPFFTTKPLGKGTGLGLATVHGIVQQSGGTVNVVSRPGAGATFTVTLPLAAPSPRPAEPPATTAAERGVGTVLLVEDEAPLRTVAKRVIERAGYRVLVAASGAEAMRTLAAPDEPIDVLLSDIAMPEMGGVELAAAARASMPGLRVVLMSGYSDTDIGAIGDGNLVDAFVAKPFTTASLIDAVNAAAAMRR